MATATALREMYFTLYWIFFMEDWGAVNLGAHTRQTSGVTLSYIPALK